MIINRCGLTNGCFNVINKMNKNRIVYAPVYMSKHLRFTVWTV